MRNRSLTSAGPVLLLAAFTVSLSAQPGRRFPAGPLQNALDADHDGTISAAELAGASRALAALDADKDGALSTEETRPRFGPNREGGGGGGGDMMKQLMSFDANSDGKLDKSEVPERMQGLFSRGDSDGNGTLTQDELQAMTSRQGDPARQGPGGGGPGGGGGGMMGDPLRAALDTDKNGAISADEIATASASLAKLDRNNDGVLSSDEFRPSMRGGGGPGRDPAEMYKRLLEENDANHDGKLAVSELPERMREFLGRADANNDGFLTQDEMAAMRGGPRRRDQ